MIIKIKKVYYCEYCGKHFLRNNPQHEKHCTANINRECRMCECNTTESIKELIEIYKRKCEIKKDDGVAGGLRLITNFTLDDIREDTSGCPACILTIIRYFLKYMEQKKCESMIGLNPFDFNYRKEVKKWWEKINYEEHQKEMRDVIY